MYRDATSEEINQVLNQSHQAFEKYSSLPLLKRHAWMHAIANALEANKRTLLEMAAEETHLSKPRLQAELTRTAFQMRSYADFCISGQWMDIRIRKKDETHPKDLRKMQVPLGPVVIFGASNFPFAYSTAGGDTACALAAGCSVIVKAHPAHVKTSTACADLIIEAANKNGIPDFCFSHVYGADAAVGEALVKHPLTQAVGFTGSLQGGKQLFDWGNQRPVPIPVFAEMGSVNPVFLLPEKLNSQNGHLANILSDSLTQSVGQFCTNPGIMIAVQSEAFDLFSKQLDTNLQAIDAAQMLHTGIAKQFAKKTFQISNTQNIRIISGRVHPEETKNASPVVMRADAKTFLKEPLLQEEIFGPYTLLVVCENMEEMYRVAESMQGQLTCTMMVTEEECLQHPKLLQILSAKAGRIVFNDVPTGVQVDLAMMHGGPFPASTDARFTAVGADGIRRFTRAISFQNCEDSVLPPPLKNSNPWKLQRTVNDQTE